MITVKELQESRKPLNKLCDIIEKGIIEHDSRYRREYTISMDKDHPCLEDVIKILQDAWYTTDFDHRVHVGDDNWFSGELAITWE